MGITCQQAELITKMILQIPHGNFTFSEAEIIELYALGDQIATRIPHTVTSLSNGGFYARHKTAASR